MKLSDIVKSLQQAQGNLEKQAILLANKHNKLFKEYMKAVYDPAISYYQTKLNENVKHWPGDCEFEQRDIDYILDEIASRKLTGNTASVALGGHTSSLDDAGRELMQFILDRSIGAKVGDSMVLRTWPDLYFLPPYMRCSLMDDKIQAKFEALEWFYVQEKMDGSYCSLKGNTEAYTRQGNKYPEWFAKKIFNGKLFDVVILGEVLVFQNSEMLSRKDGNGVLNSVMAGEDSSSFAQYEFRHIAWDMLTFEEFSSGKSTRPYKNRFANLFENRPKHLVVKTDVVFSIKEAYSITGKYFASGKEGSILKNPNGLWKDGTSTDDVKLKIKFEIEGRCTGIFEGKGKYKGMMGGAQMQSEDGLMEWDVGTGFSDDQRKDFFLHPEKIVGKVVANEANDIIQSKDKRKKPSLSLPVFTEVRMHDKTVADTYERIVAQLEAVKRGEA